MPASITVRATFSPFSLRWLNRSFGRKLFPSCPPLSQSILVCGKHFVLIYFEAAGRVPDKQAAERERDWPPRLKTFSPWPPRTRSRNECFSSLSPFLGCAARRHKKRSNFDERPSKQHFDRFSPASGLPMTYLQKEKRNKSYHFLKSHL